MGLWLSPLGCSIILAKNTFAVNLRRRFDTNYAMAGGTKTHNRLVRQIARLLEDGSLGKKYEVFTENVKLRIPMGKRIRFYYPDSIVSCQDNDEPTWLESPCAIVEVLSGSTERIDRGEKPERYQGMAGLERYILVDSRSQSIEVWARTKKGWELSPVLDIPCIKLKLTAEQIYQNIALDQRIQGNK